MVFERQLDDSIQSWNLCDDTFLYIEKNQPSIINVIELKQRQTATLVSIEHDIPVESLDDPKFDSSSISKQALSFNDGFVLYGTSNKIYYLKIDKVLENLTSNIRQKNYKSEQFKASLIKEGVWNPTNTSFWHSIHFALGC